MRKGKIVPEREKERGSEGVCTKVNEYVCEREINSKLDGWCKQKRNGLERCERVFVEREKPVYL
jgi:hypothetical protein